MPTPRHRFPDSPVFYRRLDREFPRAVGAAGCWIEDANGKRYLDAAGGAMVANLGHGSREVADAVAEAIGELGYVNASQFTHRHVEELAAELVARLPGGPWHVYFLASGSEAIEAAVKLARQVQVERGRPAKWKVIARTPSYHGNTLAALSLSGREHYRKVFGPLLTDFPRIAAPDPYRDPDGPGSTGEALERELARQDPATVAAFLAEPIGGSSSGAAVPERAYWDRVAALCRAHDVLLIADEVMCGVGRTGRFLAGEHFDLAPDIVVLGKGLNGGAVPLSAVAARRELVETLAAGSGYFNHAQTYSHTPAIAAAGLATLRILRRERLVERVAALEGRLFAELGKLRAHELVGDVRGRGFLAAVELVADRRTKRPFPRALGAAERLTARAFEAGLILWPNVGHVDGTRGDLVMLGPPFTISESEIAELGRRLDLALAATAAELAGEAVEKR
jgi:adenosylmethionine-8-amino-7-oxononanoate aminotransferase